MSKANTKAIILVGGDTRGTRFRPLSLDIPKVLFPIGGKPLISHIIDPISKISSIKDVLIIGFYENIVFNDYLHLARLAYPHLNIKYLREYKALGTAGGLYHFRDEIKRNNPENILVVHGDIICSFPFEDILEFFSSKSSAKSLIYGIDVPQYLASHPHSFGAIVADSDNKVVHYVEKPENKLSNLINGGIYLFDRVYIIDKIAAIKHQKDELIDDVSNVELIDKDVVSLEHDILTQLPEDNSFFVYKPKKNNYWRQLKRAASALPANELALSNSKQENKGFKCTIVEPVYIDPTAKISATAKVGPNVSIGSNCIIGDGVSVTNSILLNNVEIDANSCILNSILSNGVKLGKWVRIEGTKIKVNDPVTYFEIHDIKFSKATILSSNTSVADEVYIKNCVVLPDKQLNVDSKLEIIM